MTIKIKNRYLFLKKIFILFFILQLNIAHSQNTTGNKLVISSIKISGNKITKDKIILRELNFAVNDSIFESELIDKIKKSELNLLKTPLFNIVNILYHIEISSVFIEIIVEERWYFWPTASLNYADQNFSNWIKEKDFTRTDFGLGLVNYNTFGRNEKLKLYAVYGYNRILSLSYSDFFIDKKRKHSISSAFIYLKRKETGVDIVNDKLHQIKITDNYAINTYLFKILYNYRNKLYSSHRIKICYENRTINDTIAKINSNYFISETNNTRYFYIRYSNTYDDRDSRNFPMSGNYFNIMYQKNGIGIFKKYGIDFHFVKVKYSKFTNLYPKIKLANSIEIKKSFGKKQPFFLQSAIGLKSNIRGYEYYLLNGEDFFLSNNTINFVLFPKKNFNFKFIPFKKFDKTSLTIVQSLFIDVAYVKSNFNNVNNKLVNEIIYSAGIGINFITYYDKLLRLEYSLNKQKEHGLYIHFEYPF